MFSLKCEAKGTRKALYLFAIVSFSYLFSVDYNFGACDCLLTTTFPAFAVAIHSRDDVSYSTDSTSHPTSSGTTAPGSGNQTLILVLVMVLVVTTMVIVMSVSLIVILSCHSRSKG